MTAHHLHPPSTADKPADRDEVVVAEFQKNSREFVRVTYGQFRGHPFVQVRLWVPGNDGKKVPTKAGLAVHPQKLPELIAALARAGDMHAGAGTA